MEKPSKLSNEERGLRERKRVNLASKRYYARKSKEFNEMKNTNEILKINNDLLKAENKILKERVDVLENEIISLTRNSMEYNQWISSL
jgi:hypothetical protein